MKREDLEKILYGTDGERIKYSHSSTYSSGTFYGKFEGVIPNLLRKYEETSSEASKRQIESVMATHKCEKCHGRRLNPISLAVTVGGLSIDELTSLSIMKELEFLKILNSQSERQ